MTTEQVIDREIETLKDAIFSGLLNEDFQDRKVIDVEVCSIPPAPIDEKNQLWLNMAEIEVPLDWIDSDEIDEYTIVNDYGYLYIGYGFIFTFDK